MTEDIWVKWGSYEAWIEHLAGADLDWPQEKPPPYPADDENDTTPEEEEKYDEA